MKYGQQYSQQLASEDFPAQWVSAAVSYRELKKCIKRIQQELQALGLDADTLQHLASSFEVHRSSSLTRTDFHETRFVPKLWVAVNRDTGAFVDAGLTEATKTYLTKRRRPSLSTISTTDSSRQRPNGIDPHPAEVDLPRGVSGSDVDWRQVSISSVSAFFEALDPKLVEQDELEKVEANRLDSAIIHLGQDIQSLTEPLPDKKHRRFRPQEDVNVWRQLFEMYLDSTVFFSSHEQDHGDRNYLTAKKQLQHFSDLLVKQGLVSQFKSPRSRFAFENFIKINIDILRVMHFQELNAVAVRKILKKFDKRTALGAQRAYLSLNPSGTFARSIAKDMCAELSTKVVSIVPQMDDYICPICCELAWRPVRLGCCKSVFCIRCVIKLQRENNDRCPMCRQPTIMHADSSCLDTETAAYLMRYFPNEVKARQKANERAAGVDKYGESFYRRTCVVM